MLTTINNHGPLVMQGTTGSSGSYIDLMYALTDTEWVQSIRHWSMLGIYDYALRIDTEERPIAPAKYAP